MSDQSAPRVITRAHIFAAAFFALFLYLLVQAAHLLAPFLSALLWGGIITLVLHPLYRRLLVLVRGKANLAAGIMATAMTILIIGPSVVLLMALSSQAVGLYHWTSDLVQTGRLAEAWGRLAVSPLGSFLSLPSFDDLDIHGFIISHLGEISSGVAVRVGAVLKNTLFFAANILILAIALFFFFRDGEAHYRTAMGLIPFTEEQKEGMARRFMDTFNAVISGVFFIALLQGLLTGIGFALFGVPFPVLWGTFAAFFALLPIGGTALVWIPGAIYLVLSGATVKGILLAAWGIVFVSLPDNLLKPVIIGKKTKIPTFFLFIAILGGIKAYGFLGIIFGPVVVTLLTAAVKIYREEFANK